MRDGMEIGELAKRAGVTRRTIRYYVALGLLPPGEEHGRNRLFTRDHLDRLQVIRRLKDEFLPLEEIGKRLAKMSDKDIAAEHSGHADPGVYRSVRSERPPYKKRSLDHMAFNAMPLPRDELDDEPYERRSTSWRREELLPGLELHVGDNVNTAALMLCLENGWYWRDRSMF